MSTTAPTLALTCAEAVDALESALRAGLDPEADPARFRVPVGSGELLLMPSSGDRFIGVKLTTVAPGNPGLGLPRIQGTYTLFDAATLAPAAVLDAGALTTLRTSAVSALAVRYLAPPDVRRLMVFGTGPQAWAHLEAIRAVRAIEHVAVVGRDVGRVTALVERCQRAGIAAEAATPHAVGAAEVICCCTSARAPLFDGGLVASDAVVVAVGSHEPTAREVDEHLVARATVVVEARSSALREAGDVIIAIGAGACEPGSLVTLDALVTGAAKVASDRPRLFKSTGMAWEDLVVAAAIHDKSTAHD